MIKFWRTARNKGVPLVAISTADQAATEALLIEYCDERQVPALRWDAVRGLDGANEDGVQEAAGMLDGLEPSLTTDPATALDMLTGAPQDAVIMIRAGSRVVADDGSPAAVRNIQAISNLRDRFASLGQTLVLLGPSFSWPAELASDVYEIDHPLPTSEERGALASRLYEEQNLKVPKDMSPITDATRGLSAFATEQAVAISLTKKGADVDKLRTWWMRTINARPGLSVDQMGYTLDDVAGLQNLKTFARQLMTGRDKPGAVIRVDEIEKAMAGSSGSLGDSSGVSQDILGQILTFMQEEDCCGMIAAGPPGAGKSMSSVAVGSAGGVPTINLDIGGLKGGIVGQSERQTRDALKTIRALAGRTFWIGTCNSLTTLRPELKRRFNFGIWYFDLPSDEEREAMWKMYLDKYKVPAEVPSDDEGWTGAEIKTACMLAYRLNITPAEASNYIVPVCRTAREQIDDLRKQANGRYTSASYPGPYKMQNTGVKQARKIRT